MVAPLIPEFLQLLSFEWKREENHLLFQQSGTMVNTIQLQRFEPLIYVEHWTEYTHLAVTEG